MTGMKNCILCFNEFEEADVPCYPPKLPELCCKYLHSSLTQEILANHSNHHNVQFCPKCFKSMMKLSDLNDQLEFHQKEISETSFIQSLEILHRRGKRLNSSCDQKIPKHTQSNGKLVEFDVSSLPNCDFKKTNSDVSDAFVTSAENYCNFSSPEDICDEDLLLIRSSAANVDIVDVTFENIKVDSEELGLVDETHDESNATIDMDAKYFKKRKQNCDSDQIVISVENEQDNFGVENGQMKLQTVLTKRDLSNSYKMTAVNKTQFDSVNWQIPSMEISDTNSINSGYKMNHELNSLINETFRCLLCVEKFRTEQELEKHAVAHSEEQSNNKSKRYLRKRPHNNDVSKRRFTLSHKIALRKNKPYICGYCPKRFTTQGNLTRHGRMHTGDQPYKCDICGRRFTYQDNLIIHSRIHSGERPYKCEVCGKGCTTQSTLTNHSRTHTGERPYKCDVCGRSFTHQNTLVVHCRIHTGEKPYKCELCGKRFTQLGTLISHNRIHTGERPYKCEVCGKGCTTQGHLNAHSRTHHYGENSLSVEKAIKMDFKTE